MLYTGLRKWQMAALCAWMIALAGCAAPSRRSSAAETSRAMAMLSHDLRLMDPSISLEEARAVAEVAVNTSLGLARNYRAVSPPILHNVYVNSGLRNRGLCFQWADDLSSAIAALPLKRLSVHRGVAHLGRRNEHSGVVLLTPGMRFEDGMLLDAWRQSGNLFWSRTGSDRYPWIEVEKVE